MRRDAWSLCNSTGRCGLIDGAPGNLDRRGLPARVQPLAEYDHFEGLAARLSGVADGPGEIGREFAYHGAQALGFGRIENKSAADAGVAPE